MKYYIRKNIVSAHDKITVVREREGNKYVLINPSEKEILTDGWQPYPYSSLVPTEEEFKSETERKIQELVYKTNVNSMINTFVLSNKEALSVKELYPVWSPNSISVKQGEKYQYENKLYEVLQSHTTQDSWSPDNQSSLWVEVVQDHEGTKEDPIPYNEELNQLWQGMILEEGKYYTQAGKVYKCVRSSGIKLTHNLADLVSGGFVEIA